MPRWQQRMMSLESCCQDIVLRSKYGLMWYLSAFFFADPFDLPKPCLIQGSNPRGWIFPDGWTTSTEVSRSFFIVHRLCYINLCYWCVPALMLAIWRIAHGVHRRNIWCSSRRPVPMFSRGSLIIRFYWDTCTLSLAVHDNFFVLRYLQLRWGEVGWWISGPVK